MGLMEWDDSFSVKVAEIDSQHQKLFELINSLYDAMKEGKSKDMLGGIIDELSACFCDPYRENVSQPSCFKRRASEPEA